MKKNSNHNVIISGLTGLLISMFSMVSTAQSDFRILGTVTDGSGQPMPYVNIAVRQLPDSSLVGGTITGEMGTFAFRPGTPGAYLFTASFIGFQPTDVRVEATGDGPVDAGTFVLQQERTALDEVVIREHRKKAKQMVDRTTYYVNSRMRSASQTGVDLMNMVPGVQVNLFNRISLDGSTRIIILVNGVRKNADYLAQLDAERIDRVEVRSSGGVRYGGEITGVINVILKDGMKRGVSGHAYANVPTKSDEVFSFPSASLNYTREKTTWYTSYNGGFSYFSIEGKDRKEINGGDRSAEIVRNSWLGQENWSHKAHFGMDHFGNEKNQLSLYGFASAFSNEQEGRIEISGSEGDSTPSVYSMIKDDADRNRSAYGSFYYRHLFRPGSELILESSYYLLRAYSGTDLTDPGREVRVSNRAEPGRDEVQVRAHFSSGINDRISVETGLEQQFNLMRDALFTSFSYGERVSAGYLQGTFKGDRFTANTGLRAEYIRVRYSDVRDQRRFFLLPQFDLKYTFNQKNNLRISYVKKVNRPEMHQLNPNPYAADPFTLQQGNPDLFPEVTREIMAMHSLSFRENYLSAGLFFRQQNGVIEELTQLSGQASFHLQEQNLGDRIYAGVKVLGSMNLHDRFSIQPHLELSCVSTRGNALAVDEGVEDQSEMEFRGRISAVWAIRDDLSLSASLQGQSTTRGIQRAYREGALYFINIDKVFFDRLKVGITSAIPFMRSFTYQGYDLSGRHFTETSEDNILMSAVPVWIRLKYSFASGERTRRLERDKVFKEERVKKGF